MLKEAIEKIVSLALEGKATEVIDLPSPLGKAIKIVGGTRMEFDTYVDARDHRAQTFQSLIDYLGAMGGDKGGIVWVNQSEVLAVIGYPSNPVKQQIRFALEPSVQRSALAVAARGGLGQEAFYDLLNDGLAGAIDEALIVQVSTLEVVLNSKTGAKINASATKTDTGWAQSLEIKNGEGGAARFGREWVWSGRVFKGMDVERYIACVLEIKMKDAAPVFRLIPRAIDDVLDSAMGEVAGNLKAIANDPAVIAQRGKWVVALGRPLA